MSGNKWARASGIAGRVTSVLVALFSVGSFAFAGCGPGDSRYYCDSNGCFECDGYGCANVSAPPVATCTGSASCSSGQVCTDLGCVTPCEGDSECARGTVCKTGYCVAPTTPVDDAKAPKPIECSANSECGANKSCVDHQCQACGGTDGPCACVTANDCQGQACVAGACTAPENACAYSSECGAGKVCKNGQCLAECTTDTQCGTGRVCAKGACTEAPASNGCTSDANCPTATPQCVSGRCVASCSNDAACGTGNYCNQGACVPDTRPQPNCRTEADCAEPGRPARACVEGYCRYRCADDASCLRIDARIGYCGTDSVCRVQGEAKPQCTTKAECPAGGDCVGNVCK